MSDKPVINELTAKFLNYYKYQLNTLYSEFSEFMTDINQDMFDYYKDNEENIMRAWITNDYDIEEEPQYRIRSGSSYLIYNLDGSVRPSSRSNAIITKKRLKQLPFDVEKAVESGIIEVEKV